MITPEIIEEAKKLIVDQDKEGAVAITRKVIDQGGDVLELMNEAFIPAINIVGDLFGRGQLFLPELIKAAAAMESVTEIVNETLETTVDQQAKKGTVVIGTVKGDVHDIGKCIVVSLFKANGFEVHDVGRDVAVDKIIEAAIEVKANIIGTSALLTTTMPEQKKLEETLKAKGLKDSIKTIVGGAPVTVRWAKRIGADAYAEDAQDGVKKARELLGLA
jgi:corrinoid protein of di/trimethylamine methyltransferase